MEGAALQQSQKLDVAMFTAWHTALFALNGYGGKLKDKSLADFLTSAPETKRPAVQNAQGIAFFHRLQARGLPVKITRNEIN